MRPLLTSAILLMTFVVRCYCDELVSVDTTAGLVTVQQKGALKSYRLRQFTDVMINGQKGTAAQLKAGMDVTVALFDAQSLSSISAKGNAASVPPAVPGKPQPGVNPFLINRANAQLTRKLVIKASIDGEDKFIIQDGVVKIRHVSWQKPKEISINGIPWKPQWDDNKSDDFTAVRLAPFSGGNVTVKKVKGRGEAVVIEPPTQTNSQKLEINFRDDGGGASDFEVKVEW